MVDIVQAYDGTPSSLPTGSPIGIQMGSPTGVSSEVPLQIPLEVQCCSIIRWLLVVSDVVGNLNMIVDMLKVSLMDNMSY